MDEIYRRWKCEKMSCINHTNYCWVDDTEDKHYKITTDIASTWAKSTGPPHYSSVDRPSERVIKRLKNQNSKRTTDSHVPSLNSKNSNINISFTMPPGSTTPYLNSAFSGAGSPQATPTATGIKQRRTPATSPAMSDKDAPAARTGFFNALYTKYPADKEKLISAKAKAEEQDLDLKTMHGLSEEAWDARAVTWGIGDKIRRNVKRFQDGRLA